MTNSQKYLNPSITVDVIIFTIINKELHVLLIQRDSDPFKNTLALPGGFILKDENTVSAAERLLRDKAHLEEKVYMEQLYTFDTPTRDPRGPVFCISYMALLPSHTLSMEKESYVLLPVNQLPRLAFDHKEIITYGVERLQAKLGYTNVVYSLLPNYFPFTELQEVYEIILGKSMDKRNFRKKFLQLNLVKETKRILTGLRQRPAKLFTFISKKPSELKKFF